MGNKCDVMEMQIELFTKKLEGVELMRKRDAKLKS